MSKSMNAFKLINTNETECTFEKGTIPELRHIGVDYFFIDTSTAVRAVNHPAPREQYVVTLKGRLEFTVTNGDTFIIEPGVLLIAQDVHGKGHQWRILDGDEWQRIYIVPNSTAVEFPFIPDNPTRTT